MVTGTIVTEAAVRDALKSVTDPHMKVSLPDMGMIKEVHISDAGAVKVDLTMPCVGCPAWEMMQIDIKKAVGALPGVSSVKAKVVWDKVWDRDDMSDSGRILAKEHGYVI